MDIIDSVKSSDLVPRGVEYSDMTYIEVATPIMLEIINPPAQVFLPGQTTREWGWWPGEPGPQTTGKVAPGSRIELLGGTIRLTDV